MVSIIIPAYNEEKNIEDCLNSLADQSYQDFEAIVVDDGSTDKTLESLSRYSLPTTRYQLLKQPHLGPGRARNLGASKAKGDILVFIDADMTFAKDFIKNLIAPIQKGQVKGTFTKEEYVSNWDNPIARAWNYNQGREGKERVAKNDPYEGSVFRAILTKEFERANGFEEKIGYTDDWSLSRKLGYQAIQARGAICYHKNPDSLKEVYHQARWVGKNEFITGSFVRKLFNLFRYNPAIQVPRSIILILKYKDLAIIPVSWVYSLAVQLSILASFTNESKYK